MPGLPPKEKQTGLHISHLSCKTAVQLVLVLTGRLVKMCLNHGIALEFFKVEILHETRAAPLTSAKDLTEPGSTCMKAKQARLRQ